MIKTKVCCTCKEEKPVSQFGKRARNKDGLREQCKGCIKDYNARYSVEYKEEISKRQAEYRLRNKDKVLKREAIYRLKNKGKIAERDSRYRANNKSYIRESKRKATREMQDHYVCELLTLSTGLSRESVYQSQGLIELKRKQLKLKRIKRQLINN